MNNELLLIINMVVLYSGILIWYKLLGPQGLFGWTVFATIAANIEVLILIDGFGIEQTLGNIMFATTFIVTDILSETEGKKMAKKAVNIGIATSLTFIIVTQIWLAYTPSKNDWAFDSIHTIFSNTPRLMAVSLIVYVIAQKFDVWCFHTVWAFTTRLYGDRTKYLWIRNNASTLISQLLNTVLYTFGAFWGIYSIDILINIAISSYIIFIITSLADTPVIYAARAIHRKKKMSQELQ